MSAAAFPKDLFKHASMFVGAFKNICMGNESITFMSFWDFVKNLVNTFRERRILYSLFTEAKKLRILQEGKDDVSILLLLQTLKKSNLVSRLDTVEVLMVPDLYEEAFVNKASAGYSRIDFEDFFLTALTLQSSFRDRRILRVLFDLIDEDGSKTIDKREILRAFLRSTPVRALIMKLESLKVLQQPGLFEDAFLAMDTSGDGEVSFEEFVQFAMGQQHRFEEEQSRGPGDIINLDFHKAEAINDDQEGTKIEKLKLLNEEITKLGFQLKEKENELVAATHHCEETQYMVDLLAREFRMKKQNFDLLRGSAPEEGDITPRDMWDVLRQQKGDDDDMVREKMYEGPYGVDEKNESTISIYEQLHELRPLFDEMWERTTGEKPKDPYEFIIQILRKEQARRRVRLGINLSLRDVNEHLPLDIRTVFWNACRDDKTEPLAHLLEEEMLNQDHRCFYVDMHNLRPGDEKPGYGYELEPDYHRGYDSTCLHAAAWFGSDKVVQFLLDHYADPLVTDVLHRQPKDVAKSDHSKLLLHCGAQRDVWKEYHNPMVPTKRVALHTKWGRHKQNNGTKWKFKFDDRDPIYQEEKLAQPEGAQVERYNSIQWSKK